MLKKYGGRRRKCKDCHTTFSLVINVTRKLKTSAEQWILDRSTLRRIEERTDVSYVSKWKQVQEYAKHVPSPRENYAKHRERASHILLVDATFTKVKGEDRAIIIAYDTGLGVVDYWIDESENATAYNCLFNRLHDAGYTPICVVSDGHGSILSAIADWNFPHQRCIFHLLQELKRKLTRHPHEELTGKRKVLYSRIKWILKTRNIEKLEEKIVSFRDHTQPIFLAYGSILEWFWEIISHATLHLSYEENVPNTSNLLENLNGQIKARIKTMRGIKSEESLYNLIKILLYFKNYKF